MSNSLVAAASLQRFFGGGARRRPLVIRTDGRPVRVVVEAAAVAVKLMIEAPEHVVARVADVAKERRVLALELPADQPLRAGEVLVPMSRAGRLGDREAEAIGRLVVSGGKKVAGAAK
uniref:Uncharacterized protein n=1 Tax=Oryza brachyantha TaxID=4533 RepID=J3KZ55_ORYBR